MLWLAIQNFYRFVERISQAMFRFLYVAFKQRIQHGMLICVRDFRATLLLSRGRRHSHLCYKRSDLEQPLCSSYIFNSLSPPHLLLPAGARLTQIQRTQKQTATGRYFSSQTRNPAETVRSEVELSYTDPAGGMTRSKSRGLSKRALIVIM